MGLVMCGEEWDLFLETSAGDIGQKVGQESGSTQKWLSSRHLHRERSAPEPVDEFAEVVLADNLEALPLKETRIQGEIWEKWGATYGRNGWAGEKNKYLLLGGRVVVLARDEEVEAVVGAEVRVVVEEGDGRHPVGVEISCDLDEMAELVLEERHRLHQVAHEHKVACGSIQKVTSGKNGLRHMGEMGRVRENTNLKVRYGKNGL